MFVPRGTKLLHKRKIEHTHARIYNVIPGNIEWLVKKKFIPLATDL